MALVMQLSVTLLIDSAGREGLKIQLLQSYFRRDVHYYYSKKIDYGL